MATTATARMTSHGRRLTAKNDNDDDSVTVVPDLGSSSAKPPATKQSNASSRQSPSKPAAAKSTTAAAQSPGEDTTTKSVDLLHDDDDESTVLLAATPSDDNKTGSGNSEAPSTMFSPATQTLNALSQNMDDLRYDIAKNKEQETEPTTSTNARAAATTTKGTADKTTSSTLSPPDAANCLSLREWKDDYSKRYEWVPITFHVEDKNAGLGMVIQRDQFFASEPRHPHSGLVHCKILRVVPGEVAEQCGVRVDDWVCRPMSTTKAPILAGFQEVQDWAKTRSFEASVLRLVQRDESPSEPPPATSTSSNKTKSLTASPSEQDAAKAMVAMCELSSPGGSSSSPRPSSMGSLLEAIEHSERASSLTLKKRPTSGKENHLPQDSTATPPAQPQQQQQPKVVEEILPFCKLCKYLKKHGKRPNHYGHKPRAHHAWCPQGAFFNNNGGDDLLDRIRQGRKLSCPACDKEYQSGKLEPVKSHTQYCLDNQRRLKKAIQERQEEEERKEKLRKRKRRREQLSASSDDEEELSAYRPPRKKQPSNPPAQSSKKAATTTTTTTKSSKSTTLAAPKAKATTTATASKPTLEEARRVTPPPSDTTQKAVARATVASTTTSSKNQATATPVVEPTTLKSRWESTDENPWGGHGYQAGDVLIYGPQSGLGHHETLLPSPRYILHPFAVGSNYRTTHCTPQEGFTVLCLCRDPCGSSPWGFGLTRDEFGHACLVEFVQPMTAASEAKALGSDEILGLKVHDMIVMVNGHTVGGMTEVGLELELKTCGPRLTLVVSRYKHAAAAAQQMAAMERTMLRVMDRSCRDERLLGWHEVGNGGVHQLSVAAAGQPQEMETETTKVVAQRGDQTPRTPITTDPPIQDDRMDDDSEGEERPDHVRDESASVHSDKIQNPISNRQVVEERKDESESFGLDVAAAPNGDEEEAEEEWEEDQNAWNGCVCGEVHKKAAKVFWIQCEDCDSWYDVSADCVGFTQKEAESIERWTCWACGSDLEESSPSSRRPSPSNFVAEAARTEETVEVPRPTKDKSSTKATIDDNVPMALQKPALPPGKPGVGASTKKAAVSIENSKGFGDSTESLAGSSLHSNTSKKSGPKKRKVKTYKDGRPSWKDRQLSKTEEGNLLSNSRPILLADGTYRKPTGRVPKGYQWDKHRGLWAPKRKPSTPVKPSAPQKAVASERGTTKTTEPIAPSTNTDSGSRPDAKSSSEKSAVKKPSTSNEEISGTGDVHLVFKKGDLVFVQHHAWPGWNCEGGIGRVNKVYLDKDGERLYDIKYVVGRSEKGISAEFVYAYTFG